MIDSKVLFCDWKKKNIMVKDNFKSKKVKELSIKRNIVS